MKDPAFLFYSQDWIVGCQTLTFEERGQYITIISQMHQQGRMKEETIRFLVGSVSDNLKSKFGIDENGFWFNLKPKQIPAASPAGIFSLSQYLRCPHSCGVGRVVMKELQKP